MVVHGKRGVEIGGALGIAGGAYWIDWGVEARSAVPSAALLEAASSGRWSVPVQTQED